MPVFEKAKRFLLVLGVMGACLGPAWAQDLLSTQKFPSLGGSDIRALPNNAAIPLFGSDLFNGAPRPLSPGQVLPQSNAAPGTAAPPRPNVSPSYIVQPGDAVNTQVYGATTMDSSSTVDAQGRIFLPTIGPVQVGGRPAGDLQKDIAAAVGQVYVKDVRVYATLISATPVNIFVAGPVAHPGQYASSSTDSVMAVLQYAGGIDPARGSYRNIQILRQGSVVATADLYDFLLRGTLPAVNLQGGDTILVGQQGMTVAVSGDARGPFRYEMKAGATGTDLLAMAQPRPDATHVSLVGMRGGQIQSFYVPLKDFLTRPLADGDTIRIQADQASDKIMVSIDGRVQGPTTFAIKRDTSLQELLAYVPVDPKFSDTRSIFIRRASVAAAQKSAINASIMRLEQSVASAPVVSDSDAQIRTQEGALVAKFADEARAVTPEGRVVVSRGGRVSNVRLEDGDVIVVPPRTDLVTVVGEVQIPQAVVWGRGLSVSQYVALAGGKTERADMGRVIVQRANGETLIGSGVSVAPGDQVIVPPSAVNNTLPIIKDITQIVYQIAVGVGVLLRL